MIIDIAFVIVMLIAIFKGFSKGLIIGIFSMLAFIIELAAALKLSVVVAEYLKDSVGSFAQWLPYISFMLVIYSSSISCKNIGKSYKKTIRFAMLGWLDTLAG
ncbi:MAG: CvpA family protein [Chitinophagaceae bacterium]